MFGEIDDDEFLLLNAYGQSHLGDADIWKAIQRPTPAHIDSSKEQIDDDQLYGLGSENLLRHGLLEEVYDHVEKGEYPPFDTLSGKFESRIQISYLGRMLLREAGIELPF